MMRRCDSLVVDDQRVPVANHKRKRPKHQRAGCLMCKPHKDEREKKEPPIAVRKRLQVARLYRELRRLVAEAFED